MGIGYIGRQDLVQAVLEIVEDVKKHRPQAVVGNVIKHMVFFEHTI